MWMIDVFDFFFDLFYIYILKKTKQTFVNAQMEKTFHSGLEQKKLEWLLIT